MATNLVGQIASVGDRVYWPVYELRDGGVFLTHRTGLVVWECEGNCVVVALDQHEGDQDKLVLGPVTWRTGAFADTIIKENDESQQTRTDR